MKSFRRLVYPYIVWAFIFIVIPMLMIVFYAFTKQGNSVLTVKFTFDNFIRFFQDKIFIDVLLRSLKLAVITTVICIIIGYPCAYFIAKLKPNSQGLMILLITIPMWINMLVRTYAWRGILLETGLSPEIKVYIGMVYNFLPFMILQIYTSLSKMDKSLIAAANDLGCDNRMAFLKVTLPLSVPGIISGITLVFLPAVSSFFIPKLLGGGSYVLVGNLVENYFVTTGDWNFGSAVSLIMTIVILISMYFTRKFDYEKDKNIVYKIYDIYVVVFSFNESKSLTNFTGFSLKWYEKMFENRTMMESIYYTVIIAIIATVVSTIVGTITAIGLSKSKRLIKESVNQVNNLPMLNPEIVTAIGLMLFFTSINMEFGFVTLLLAHIIFCIPYVILSIMPKLRQLDDNIAEAALDLGCTPFQALYKVIIPQITPGIVSGALIAFTMSFDDFVISYFVTGPGINNISTYVYSSVKRINPSVNALSSLIVFAITIVLILVNVIPMISERKKKKLI